MPPYHTITKVTRLKKGVVIELDEKVDVLIDRNNLVIRIDDKAGFLTDKTIAFYNPLRLGQNYAVYGIRAYATKEETK